MMHVMQYGSFICKLMLLNVKFKLCSLICLGMFQVHSWWASDQAQLPWRVIITDTRTGRYRSLSSSRAGTPWRR